MKRKIAQYVASRWDINKLKPNIKEWPGPCNYYWY